ncbi:MAG: response regulator [Candidatus Eisenbacteria sp.]|nr:response regulator [Candidatus Eisenbacteria bacterium]
MSKKSILVIEDTKSVRQIVAAMLLEEGYEVITAIDGKDGLEMAKRERPDLVVLDVMLPEMNGYEVCCRIKFDEQYEHIPVILLTARRKEADRRKAAQTGADVYLTKPFERDQLMQEVKRLLEQKSGSTANTPARS